jgi:zinc transport system permease protein
MNCLFQVVEGFVLAQVPLLQSQSWLERILEPFTRLFPEYSFFNIYTNVIGLLAVILVSLICGGVGSLVVSNRMAFFSDALAHCAFAGVALGFLAAYFSGLLNRGGDFFDWAMPIMVGFGILVGLAIAWVRETTSLASDTVIGVFFAGAMGLGGMLLQGISRRFFYPEDFLYGSVATVTSKDLTVLLILALATAPVLAWLYNDLIFTSFNSSLARSRRVRVRLCNYLFIVLLAVIVNLCLRTVGALLINALLIVPAATASNLCRNLRQMFWLTTGLCLAVSIAGFLLSSWITLPLSKGPPLKFGSGGMIVVLSVLLFFLSLPFAWGARKPRGQVWARAGNNDHS